MYSLKMQRDASSSLQPAASGSRVYKTSPNEGLFKKKNVIVRSEPPAQHRHNSIQFTLATQSLSSVYVIKEPTSPPFSKAAARELKGVRSLHVQTLFNIQQQSSAVHRLFTGGIFSNPRTNRKVTALIRPRPQTRHFYSRALYLNDQECQTS